MEPVPEPPLPEEQAFACPHCGSSRVRRSAPHGLWEQVVRSFTPYRYYRCKDCGRRGRYVGRLPSRGRPSGRPVERRDIRAAKARRLRLLASVAISVFLGVAAGIYLHGCQERAERERAAQP